jgi:hypothetical protein
MSGLFSSDHAVQGAANVVVKFFVSGEIIAGDPQLIFLMTSR